MTAVPWCHYTICYYRLPPSFSLCEQAEKLEVFDWEHRVLLAFCYVVSTQIWFSSFVNRNVFAISLMHCCAIESLVVGN